MEKYKIIDSNGNEVMSDISESFFNFICDVEQMKNLYKRSKYTKSEDLCDVLKDKLYDVAMDIYTS